MFDRFTEDVRTVRETDPAAKSTAEVLLYAGLHAVWAHRVAHWLWNRGFRLTARALSQVTRLVTGVEIHPAATLGRRVVIDHGMGVVVGETAEVGDDVSMYHGVTLGGSDPRPVKRHPTVRDGVTLGARATLIGDITVGEGATVGAGAVVVEDVPPGATVAGNPAERVDTPDQETAPESRDTPEDPLADPAAGDGGPADPLTGDGQSADPSTGDGRAGDTSTGNGEISACEEVPDPAWVPGG